VIQSVRYFRTAACVAVIVTFVGTSAVQVGFKAGQIKPSLQFHQPRWEDGGGSYIEKWARRLIGLREALGAEQSVGFATDWPAWLHGKMLVQSMVAPTVVMDSDQRDLIVGAFEEEDGLQAYIQRRRTQGDRIAVRRRFGQGVAILERGVR